MQERKYAFEVCGICGIILRHKILHSFFCRLKPDESPVLTDCYAKIAKKEWTLFWPILSYTARRWLAWLWKIGMYRGGGNFWGWINALLGTAACDLLSRMFKSCNISRSTHSSSLLHTVLVYSWTCYTKVDTPVALHSSSFTRQFTLHYLCPPVV